MRPTHLCCILLLLIGYATSAQRISGKMTDTETKQPIPFASLQLTEFSNPTGHSYTTSNTLGVFRFNRVSKGRYTLSASMMGYKKFQREFILDSIRPSIDLGEISLEEEPGLLNTVTINGGTPGFSTTNGQMKIGVAGNSFFKSASNLMDVLHKIPGLQVSPDGTMLLGSRTAPTLFVDGRPVNMNPDEVQAYLGNLSPDMVESIELINQPSSKYDGQYQGIIDVRLKKNLSLGLKGTYNLRFQQNDNTLIDNNLSLNYKSTKFAYCMSLVHTIGDIYYRYHALQYLTSGNAMVTNTRTITGNHNYNIQARVAYEPRKGQNIEAFVRTYQINRNGATVNQLITLDNALANTIAVQHGDNDSRPRQHNYAGGINYDAQFKTGELHIVTALAQIDNRQREDIQNTSLPGGTLLNYWKTNSRNNILIRSAQADYTQQLGAGKLEFGSKYAHTTTDNNLRYDTLGTNGFEPDPTRSNLFNYSEHIASGYLSYLGAKGKFNYSFGMRTEHTKTLTGSLAANTMAKRNYLKWLPSANLTYDLQEGQQLSLSYSKRITRPTFDALNPFRFYYSPRHYWIGNPNLQPSTTNLLSLSYSRKSLNMNINAGREIDPMVRYPEYDPVTNVLAFKGANLPYRDFANIQASIPITISNWWKTSNSIGLYYNRELRPYFGQTFQIPVFNYTIRGSQVFTLEYGLIDLNYSYESKSGNSLYFFAPVLTFDIGLQKSWLGNRISTKLALQDVFNGGKRRIIFREKSIMDNDFYHDNGTNRFIFSLTYNFGRSTYRQKEVRKTDEETRAGR